MERMLSLDEITLIPAGISTIKSREECSPFIYTKLPVFIAPMTCLIDNLNYSFLQTSELIPILPVHNEYNNGEALALKGLEFDNPIYNWQALSLKSFEDLFLSKEQDKNLYYNILIDCANGNMVDLYNLTKKVKDKYNRHVTIMIGNIANPNSYENCINYGVDYVRVGIGGGCFIPGQKVILANGEEKNIEDIQVGDIVKTHTGENHKVEETHCYDRDEILYDINGIKCTANHEFYVINISDEEKVTEENLSEFAYWLPADKLDINLHRLIEL